MARRIVINASGLRVSKIGRDAWSSNAEDLLIDTSRRNTRAYLSGRLQGNGGYNGDFASGYGTYQITAAHGLGYIPLFWAAQVGGSGVTVRIDSGRIIAEFYQQYSGSPPGSAAMPGYVDYVLFYDRWF